MLAVFAPAYVVVGFAYAWVLQARGQHEGDLLAMTEDLAGVALEIVFVSVLAAAPVAGIVFAIRSLRCRTTRSAWAALAAHGALLLLVLYQFADAIRMSFFAPLD